MPRLGSFSSRSLINTASAIVPSVKSYYGSSGLFNTVTDPNLILITTQQAKWGNRSLAGAINSWELVSVPLSETISPPFTVEGWVMHGASYAIPNWYNAHPFNVYNSGSNVNAGVNTFSGQNITIQATWLGTMGEPQGQAVNDDQGPPTANNVWVHVALAFHTATTMSAWVNGQRRLNFDLSALPPASNMAAVNMLKLNPMAVGTAGFYYDDIRVSNIDRYGSVDTITLPTAPFSSDANTVALVNFE